MNLETKPSYNAAVKKQTLSVGTIVLGVALISVSIILTLLITVPELAQAIIQAKGQIFKGLFIGVTILPIFLFVTIKGGKTWYKQLWSWIAVGITCVALIGITLGSTFMNQPKDMNGGMQMEEGMNMEGTTSEDMDANGDVVIMN
nr:hypothetical protein [uncultured Niameybacter sp.]